ncbi:FGGY family carbohydrate kinase [Nocardia sp. BMG51109]|uniref:FGGY family carbohydrate kinase n=1 Tax=Nocardia sp. BMG51109 TaxID=1056816 RepID=UPI0018DE1B63|nr:FGGY family carbohydrate kinase [Nocardia sp. BMG51109]
MGRRDVVLGADVGSTNVKVVALDAAGHIVARVRRPTPRRTGEVSIDAMVLFELFEELVIEACGGELAAVAVCAAGVGEDGVLVDEDGHPLDAALAWFDPRRTALFHELEPELSPAAGLGVVTDAARTLVGWAWAARRPGAERAKTWLALTDFASCRWSGVDFMSDTLAARTAAWQVRGRTWAEDRVRATLGSPGLLPAVLRAGDIVGPLRSERLRDAGVLAAQAVVVAGGHDHPIGGWGVDRLSPGAVLDSMGTAEVVVAQSMSIISAGEGIDTAPGIGSTGSTLLRVEELARNVEWASQDPAVAAALQQMISGALPPDGYLSSGTFRPGAAGGARPRYTADAPAAPTSRASAVLGALAALGNQAVQDISALVPDRSRVFTAGGWARSHGWIEIKQAVTGRPVTVITEPETTAAGAALLAARALGWSPDPATTLAYAPAPVP